MTLCPVGRKLAESKIKAEQKKANTDAWSPHPTDHLRAAVETGKARRKFENHAARCAGCHR